MYTNCHFKFMFNKLLFSKENEGDEECEQSHISDNDGNSSTFGR